MWPKVLLPIAVVKPEYCQPVSYIVTVNGSLSSRFFWLLHIQDKKFSAQLISPAFLHQRGAQTADSAAMFTFLAGQETVLSGPPCQCCYAHRRWKTPS